MLSILSFIFILLMSSNGERTVREDLYNAIQSSSTECMQCTGATAADTTYLGRGHPCVGKTQGVLMYCIYRHWGIFNETSLASEEDIFDIYDNIVQNSAVWNERVRNRTFHVCWSRVHEIINEDSGEQATIWHNCVFTLLQNEEESKNSTTRYREWLYGKNGGNEKDFNGERNEKCTCEDNSGSSYEERSERVYSTDSGESSDSTRTSQEHGSKKEDSTEVQESTERSLESHPHSSENTDSTEYSRETSHTPAYPYTSQESESGSSEEDSSTDPFHNGTDVSTDTPNTAYHSNVPDTTYTEHYTSTIRVTSDRNTESSDSTSSSNTASTTEEDYLSSVEESTSMTAHSHGYGSRGTFHYDHEKFTDPPSTLYFSQETDFSGTEQTTGTVHTTNHQNSEELNHHGSEHSSEITDTSEESNSRSSDSSASNLSHERSESTSSLGYTDKSGSSYESSSEEHNSSEIKEITMVTDDSHSSAGYLSTDAVYFTHSTDLSTVRITQQYGSKEEDVSATTSNIPYKHSSEKVEPTTIDTPNISQENNNKDHDSDGTTQNIKTTIASDEYSLENANSLKSAETSEVINESGKSKGYSDEGNDYSVSEELVSSDASTADSSSVHSSEALDSSSSEGIKHASNASHENDSERQDSGSSADVTHSSEASHESGSKAHTSTETEETTNISHDLSSEEWRSTRNPEQQTESTASQFSDTHNPADNDDSEMISENSDTDSNDVSEYSGSIDKSDDNSHGEGNKSKNSKENKDKSSKEKKRKNKKKSNESKSKSGEQDK